MAIYDSKVLIKNFLDKYSIHLQLNEVKIYKKFKKINKI
jgi:hypothetical protein